MDRWLLTRKGSLSDIPGVEGHLTHGDNFRPVNGLQPAIMWEISRTGEISGLPIPIRERLAQAHFRQGIATGRHVKITERPLEHREMGPGPHLFRCPNPNCGAVNEIQTPTGLWIVPRVWVDKAGHNT
jgi:hypothetical protein